ncbi:hypothetical protein FKP32DRAFT_1687951 [Trametes sanguinea]|nr:hypothetical protein FKP32DRAFT_1687951 [Trametes sanguinea]
MFLPRVGKAAGTPLAVGIWPGLDGVSDIRSFLQVFRLSPVTDLMASIIDLDIQDRRVLYGTCIGPPRPLGDVQSKSQSGPLSWLERGANNAKVVGSIPALANLFHSLPHAQLQSGHNCMFYTTSRTIGSNTQQDVAYTIVDKRRSDMSCGLYAGVDVLQSGLLPPSSCPSPVLTIPTGHPPLRSSKTHPFYRSRSFPATYEWQDACEADEDSRPGSAEGADMHARIGGAFSETKRSGEWYPKPEG